MQITLASTLQAYHDAIVFHISSTCISCDDSVSTLVPRRLAFASFCICLLISFLPAKKRQEKLSLEKQFLKQSDFYRSIWVMIFPILLLSLRAYHYFELLLAQLIPQSGAYDTLNQTGRRLSPLNLSTKVSFLQKAQACNPRNVLPLTPTWNHVTRCSIELRHPELHTALCSISAVSFSPTLPFCVFEVLSFLRFLHLTA